MLSLAYGKIAAGLGALVLVVIVVAALKDYGAARMERAEYRTCQAVAAGKKGAPEPHDGCAKPIAQVIETARQAITCANGLRPASSGDWVTPATCPTQVQALAQDRNAQVANLKDANAQLSRARTERNEAIQRAEARAAAEMRRQNDVTTALNRAPRGPDGLLLCAGDCLRGLAGE